MNICDEDFCWLCSMPGSCCNCEFSDFTWSTPPSQESCAFDDDREKQANFDVDELASRTVDGNCILGDSLVEDPDFEINDMVPCPGRRSQPEQPCEASTPKNDGYAEEWKSPGAMPPPDSSSPYGLGTDSSPCSTDPALSMSRGEDVIEGRLLFCRLRDSGQLGVGAPFNDRVPTTASTNRFPSHSPTPKLQIRDVTFAQTDMGASLQVRGRLANTSKRSSSAPDCIVAQGFLDERLRAISEQQVVADDVSVDVQGICAVTTRTAIEHTNGLADKIDPVSARGSLVPAARKRAVLSGPTILDLAISTELEFASSHSTDNDRSHDTTSTSRETNGNDGVASNMNMLPRRVSMVSVSFPAQATLDGSPKRRRSSVDCLPESKKRKLDRVASHVSCASDLSVEFKYQATEPASIRRARSLRSEVSACSGESTDSPFLFYPSPLSLPIFRPCLDRDYPPTVPSTPLPNSVDYTRSKANPLARTVAIYRRRSSNGPAILPVPIIAPPTRIRPTFVRCAEDQAIDRLHALLRRERSERERDGLNAHDEKRRERLKAVYGRDLTFSRRDSASTSDSSDGLGQWEEESTLSAIEWPESQESAPSVKILPGQHRLVSQETWSNAFGVANDLRKEVTGWILKKLPKEPVSHKKPSLNERHLGVDLYDQLTNSRQTRFHAAQLFQRYFLLSRKVQVWSAARKHELSERESWISRLTSHWERGVWDLAVACIALSVKLHRDCLPPLGPVYASEFLDMAPYAMTHAAFELAQRDVMYTFEFLLGSCTPQDVLDELWDALPTLRKATAPIRDGWAVVQCVTWDKLFESLFEPDVSQYPVSLLTAAALIEGLLFALARHYKAEAEANVCECKTPPKTPRPAPECVPDGAEPTSWQIHRFEASQLVDDVILDVKDVLQLSDHHLQMELDECRTWLSYVGQE